MASSPNHFSINPNTSILFLYLYSSPQTLTSQLKLYLHPLYHCSCCIAPPLKCHACRVQEPPQLLEILDPPIFLEQLCCRFSFCNPHNCHNVGLGGVRVVGLHTLFGTNSTRTGLSFSRVCIHIVLNILHMTDIPIIYLFSVNYDTLKKEVILFCANIILQYRSIFSPIISIIFFYSLLSLKMGLVFIPNIFHIYIRKNPNSLVFA